MEIIPDPTVMALQLIPFLVTLAALYKIILAPMLDYLEERQSAIESGTTGVDQMNADLEARAADYENQLKSARSAGAEIRGARRVEAKAGYDAHIATARGEAESQINEAIVEIQASAGSAREELQGSSQVLAAQISSQVLGRPVA